MSEPDSFSLKTRNLIAGRLVDWFEKEGADYPWRRTDDPYAILVSELMLQQTQIATVLGKGYFDRWMRRFPDVETLAEAGEDDVLKAWEGLGYYNRARNLQKAATKVVEKYSGKFPETIEEILDLPGVGRYTAGAVMSFAFQKPEPIVDGNVARVFSRLFHFTDPIDTTAGQKLLWKWAEELLPEKNAKAYNSGLMELGQKICRKGSPNCESCCLSEFCLSRELSPADLPVKKHRQKIERTSERVAFVSKGDQVLLEKGSGSRRKGLWKLPDLQGEAAADYPEIFSMTYGITKYRVKLTVCRLRDFPIKGDSSDHQWFSVSEIDDLAVAAPYRKALTRLIANEFSEESFELS